MDLEEKTEDYEKPMIKKHAIVMTMSPAGSKMGHGLFPFVTKTPKYQTQSPYIETQQYRR
ncbi:hypothetical protein J4226_05520 [Candidatus Pacearchaeota archaeon]|nr:hypothetical protein [Candidatus Pacearchaeota archaeon]